MCLAFLSLLFFLPSFFLFLSPFPERSRHQTAAFMARSDTTKAYQTTHIILSDLPSVHKSIYGSTQLCDFSNPNEAQNIIQSPWRSDPPNAIHRSQITTLIQTSLMMVIRNSTSNQAGRNKYSKTKPRERTLLYAIGPSASP